MTFGGTDAEAGALCELAPTTRPGCEKLSGLLADFEQMLPMVKGPSMTLVWRSCKTTKMKTQYLICRCWMYTHGATGVTGVSKRCHVLGLLGTLYRLCPHQVPRKWRNV